MIKIGSFSFPSTRTWWRSTTVEALSKERREIVIEAIIATPEDPTGVRRGIEELECEVERLDRGEATISLHPGRFFAGRRRELSTAPCPRGDAVRVRLTILTLDRFERSEILHRESMDLQPPTNSTRVLNRGNQSTPPCFEIQPSGSVSGFEIEVGADRMTYSGPLESGDHLLLDCENNKATLNETTNVTHLVDVFRWLSPGWSRVAIHASGSANGDFAITYRDLWI